MLEYKKMKIQIERQKIEDDEKQRSLILQVTNSVTTPHYSFYELVYRLQKGQILLK